MQAGHSWFQPNDGAIARAFREAAETIGPRFSSLVPRVLLDSPDPSTIVATKKGLRGDVSTVDQEMTSEVSRFVANVLGKIYSISEEFVSDPFLDGLCKEYEVVGLSRHRSLLVYRSVHGDLLGVAVVHTGPIGVNFSQLENRIDLIVRGGLSLDERVPVATQLLASAYEAAGGSLARRIMTDQDTAAALSMRGCSIIRDYQRFTWLHAGPASSGVY
ncbi:hypothetical protein K2Y11_05530 [bacterium]|nr:hypothetical protein [bacterium]